MSTEAARAVADFERVLPGVVDLAFDGLVKAQQYLLGLLRLSEGGHAQPRLIVIRCSHADLDVVFELCKKDYFDACVLYWPQAHNGHRLAMTVGPACRRLLSDTGPGRLVEASAFLTASWREPAARFRSAPASASPASVTRRSPCASGRSTSEPGAMALCA